MDVRESYKVLELEIGASREALDAAYFRLIERWHPDRAATGGADAVREAQRMVQVINEAYQTLAKIAPGAAAASAPLPKTPAPPGAAPTAAPGGGTRAKLSPLPADQQPTASRLPPSGPPPPAGAWAARAAPAASSPPPPTLPPSSAPPPGKPLPPPPTVAAPPPPANAPPSATTKVEAPAASAPPPAPKLVLPMPAFVAGPLAKWTAFRGKVTGYWSKVAPYYDLLFPVASPRRRFGPVIVAAVLVVFLLLAKCALTPSGDKRAGPDPRTTGRLVVKSNLAATLEAVRVTAPGEPVSASVTGTVGQEMAGLPPGRYAVTARVDGWPEVHGEANLEAGQASGIEMKFKSGSLRLDSDPTGASVRWGEAVLGQTPLVIPLLPPGECQLTVEYPTWPAVTYKATITENVEATGTVRLPHGKVILDSSPAGATVLVGKKVVGRTPLTLERVPAGVRKFTLQAKDFPTLEVSVTVEDGKEATINQAMAVGFPVLDPAVMLHAVWVPDNPDRIAPAFEGQSGPSKPQNGVVRNLDRKRVYDLWMRRSYRYTGTVKSFDRATGQVEFAEQECDLSRYRVLAKLSVEARNDPDLAAQLTKGGTLAVYGRLSAVEEPRWLSKVITLEFSPAEPLR